MSKSQPSIPRGLRLLSFDGGGLRALSQAKILQETMDRIVYDESTTESGVSRPTPRVADHFDMVCGSGFGGLLAIMAGILGMTGKELVDEFTALSLAVFSGDASLDERTARLESEIKRMIKKYSPEDHGEDRKMISDASPCKVFVCAALSDNLSSPRLLRNYKVRSNASPDCKVWEAGMATCALIGIFRSITIDSTFIGERFAGGEVRWNNPTHELTVEVANIFAGHDIACIVSVGSGHPGVLSLSEGDNKLFRRITEDCEQVANDLFRRLSRVPDLYWRLSVEQGMQDIDLADIQELTKILASTRSYLQTSRPNNDVDALINVLTAAKGRTSVTVIAGKISAVAETMYLMDCPAPTLHFTGQKEHLKKLHTYFANQAYRFHIAVLSGLGGTGKTQCGLMFVQLSLDENRFTEVFFVDASDQISLETGYKNIAQAKGVGESFEDGLRYLQMRSDAWLLFFDNADNPELDLGRYIHRRHGNVLITTRNPHIGDLAPDCHCRIGRLDQADAMDLLLRGVIVPESVDRNTHAAEIVEVLGCLALAVNQTRAFLAKGTCALPYYLQLYRDNRERFLRDHPPQPQSTDSYAYTVFTTWTISFNCLSNIAKTFLQIICFMHHEGIPLFIFSRACESLLELEMDDRESTIPITLSNFLSTFTTEESAWDEFRFLQLIEEVQSFSLVEFDSLNQTVSLHPLVQQWAQYYSRTVDSAIHTTQTILALATPIGEGASDFSARKSLLLHFRDSLKSGPWLHHSYYSNAGKTLRDGGLYAEASSLWGQDLEVKRRIFGSEHPDTFMSMNNLAKTYSELARHAEALKLNEEVVELCRRILGLEHPNTLTSMSNLAITYSNLARHADALKLDEEVVELRRRILGSEHPDTLTSMNNLAVTYSDLARHAKALKLNEEVVELRRRILSSEHPNTLTSMSNLAITYSNLARHADALKLNEEVVELRRRILGSEHPDTLTSMSNLALTYSNLVRYADALKLDEEVVELRRRILGSEHPDTLTSMSNLALTYSNLVRYADALKLDEEVVELRRRILGSEHPDTLTSMSNLALTYSNLVRYADALKLDEEVVELRRRILGSEHPDTLTSMSNLAKTYSELARHAEALKLNEEVVELRRHILGLEHPDTLTSMGNLALTYSNLARHAEALKLNEEVVELHQRILGSEHPNTLTSMSNLAVTYSDLSRHAEALKLEQEVVELRRCILGPEHQHTLASMNNLAATYSDLARHAEALKLDEEVVEMYRRILGSEHPDTLTSMGNLALTYSNLARHAEALKLNEEVVELRQRILGSEHPDTLRSMHNTASTFSALHQHTESVQLQDEVAELSKQVLNSDHPDSPDYIPNLPSYRKKKKPRKRDRVRGLLGLPSLNGKRNRARTGTFASHSSLRGGSGLLIFLRSIRDVYLIYVTTLGKLEWGEGVKEPP
ncbi:hypothetical protein DL96DRAFT_1752984 [Flagelloscypha sp. PMI_526]|nr:hypothetical protein DL96DRAFT_1752984 [Flagelloscypha sp. PMI_526]